jgi:RecA-family ATPase
MKEEALKYLQAGFSIIPLGSITKNSSGSKNIEYPIPWKEYQQRKATSDEIKTWKYNNIGIVTGRVSNLLVLDVDQYKPNFDKSLIQSFKLPITPVQQTASGGKQYFFKYPVDIDIYNAVCIGHNASGIDIRGEGGMVIVPPTKTPYGAYTWLIDPFTTPVANLPPILLEMLKKEHSSENKEKKSIVELSSLAEGEGRDNALTSFCGTLAHSLSPDRWSTEIPPAMKAINDTYKPPLPMKDLERIYKSITEKELKGRTSIPLSTKLISLSELMNKEFPEVNFAIEPFFERGTLNMLSAPPNTWKSWLLFYFAVKTAKGDKIFDNFKTEKSKILIVNEEDPARLIQDRFRILGVKKENLDIYLHIMEGMKINQQTVDLLLKEIKEKKIDVLIFDSLRAIHDANENDSQEMQKVMDFMKQFVRVGITIIFTHHNRKKTIGDKGDNAELSRGSTAINAAIAGHLSLEEEKREGVTFLVMRHLKSKAGPKHDPVEIEIVNDEEDKIEFVYKGQFKENENRARQAKELIYTILSQDTNTLKSIKDFKKLKVASESNIREGLAMLKKDKLIKHITRKKAEEDKLIPVSKGKANELLYRLVKKDEFDELVDELSTGQNY